MASKQQVVKRAKELGVEIDWRNSALSGSDCMFLADAPEGFVFGASGETVLGHGWVQSGGEKDVFWKEILDLLAYGIFPEEAYGIFPEEN